MPAVSEQLDLLPAPKCVQAHSTPVRSPRDCQASRQGNRVASLARAQGVASSRATPNAAEPAVACRKTRERQPGARRLGRRKSMVYTTGGEHKPPAARKGPDSRPAGENAHLSTGPEKAFKPPLIRHKPPVSYYSAEGNAQRETLVFSEDFAIQGQGGRAPRGDINKSAELLITGGVETASQTPSWPMPRRRATFS